MPTEPPFLDASFPIALFDRRDQMHGRAVSLRSSIETCSILTTEGVLVEIANAMSERNRPAACAFFDRCYLTANIRVVTVDSGLLRRGMDVYRSGADKGWGLTDCVSFGVMWEAGLSAALTADRHFVQAGFRALMLEAP